MCQAAREDTTEITIRGNCMDGYLPLVEHATNGKKDYQEETPKARARRLRYDDQITHWLGIGISNL